MRLYANKNFPFPAAEELRGVGNDVLTSPESEPSRQAASDDPNVLRCPRSGAGCLAPHRRHFIRQATRRP